MLRVSEALLHPSYASRSVDNDVALLLLDGEADLEAGPDVRAAW